MRLCSTGGAQTNWLSDEGRISGHRYPLGAHADLSIHGAGNMSARVWFIPSGGFDETAPTLADLENAIEITHAFQGTLTLHSSNEHDEEDNNEFNHFYWDNN